VLEYTLTTKDEIAILYRFIELDRATMTLSAVTQSSRATRAWRPTANSPGAPPRRCGASLPDAASRAGRVRRAAAQRT
jgi:hypothetical protein